MILMKLEGTQAYFQLILRALAKFFLALRAKKVTFHAVFAYFRVFFGVQ